MLLLHPRSKVVQPKVEVRGMGEFEAAQSRSKAGSSDTTGHSLRLRAIVCKPPHVCRVVGVNEAEQIVKCAKHKEGRPHLLLTQSNGRINCVRNSIMFGGAEVFD